MQIGTSTHISDPLNRLTSNPSRKSVAGERNDASSDIQQEVQLRTGRENILRLGRLALGEFQLDRWREQGLEVTDKTLEAAYEALNQAFKQQQQTPGSAGIAINVHQIVSDNQAVPDWFTGEQKQHLEANQVPGAKNAFLNGRYFHIQPSTEGDVSQAVQSYTSIRHLQE